MTIQSWLLLSFYLSLLLLLSLPLGIYITKVMQGNYALLTKIERPLLRTCAINSSTEMNWWQYTLATLIFNVLGAITLYMLQITQYWLPLNPQQLANVNTDSAINTAISFVTNTNWQGYSGETTMSYFTQMLGLTVQNFLSAATGIAVAIALIRGLARHTTATIGNAWIDLFRATIWILLPLSLLFSIVLISQGVIQNFNAYSQITTLEGPTQTLAMGPVASQEAIKMLGTNGGGFFNANSAHPYENPTPLINFLQMLSIFLIPGALCFTFGNIVGDKRQGWTIFIAMTLLFVAGAILAIIFEQHGNPLLSNVMNTPTTALLDGNMEGKEMRFGIADSALFATITTAASCGAVNAMHDSFTPLGGLIPLIMIQLGEVVFGGVGSGLYGMLIFAILAVFIAGLMIGRTPEYLGKKIEVYEMQMMAIVILITPLLVLIGTAIAVMTTAGRAGIANHGAHGFSEILYAFSSAANNNGSAFAGLSANTPFYNWLLAIIMWLGRFGVIVPVLALAGSLANKKRGVITAGTLPTHGQLFVALLIGVVLLIGLLNYVPALALGPVIEHLMLWSTHV